eukprot:2906884-Heterocapsa_arctica.AAC.1
MWALSWETQGGIGIRPEEHFPLIRRPVLSFFLKGATGGPDPATGQTSSVPPDKNRVRAIGPTCVGVKCAWAWSHALPDSITGVWVAPAPAIRRDRVQFIILCFIWCTMRTASVISVVSAGST